MIEISSDEFLIFYRDSCAKCRLLSWAAIIMSFGILRRVAISSEEAQAVYEQFPESRGKLLLVLHGRCFTGVNVFLNFPLTVIYWILLKARVIVRRHCS